jgi:protein arginine kinase activator
MVMKCQRCPKPATFHITDIERGKPKEFHFCDEHARQHLSPSAESGGDKGEMSSLAEKLSQGALETTRGEGPSSDKLACPLCQMNFQEFRNTGRLGCPYDYEVFRDELMPLLENIHEETRHTGKFPRRAPRDPVRQTELIQLRNEQKRAIAAEDYEAAARIRDKIKGIENDLGR